MADILNQALKDANYGVSGKNANPSVFYKVTAYSFTRTSSTEVQYSVTVAVYMNSGGTMGTGNALDIKLRLSAEGIVLFDKYIKDGVTWSGKGDSTAAATVTLTGTAQLSVGGTSAVKFLAYRPSQSGDVISASNSAPGAVIGSGEVVNTSYTMEFPLPYHHVKHNGAWCPGTVKVNQGGQWVDCTIEALLGG